MKNIFRKSNKKRSKSTAITLCQDLFWPLLCATIQVKKETSGVCVGRYWCLTDFYLQGTWFEPCGWCSVSDDDQRHGLGYPPAHAGLGRYCRRHFGPHLWKGLTACGRSFLCTFFSVFFRHAVSADTRRSLTTPSHHLPCLAKKYLGAQFLPLSLAFVICRSA